jgi:CRISPR-associated endoribonuclease Cas6
MARTTADSHHEITLQFITPTRITEKNQLTNQLSFELLLRNLLRRGSLLAEVHAPPGRPWPIDFSSVLEYGRANVELRSSNLTWYDWERFSNRQQRRINLKGFIGTVRYHGELTPFLPLIELGHFIHIGKNTSFGMGYYVVE